MPKIVNTERLKRSDLEIIDFIVAHPEMTETACVIACGWTKGGSGKIMQRIRPQLDARLAKNSASVDKDVVKRITVGRKDVIDELWDMARAWRDSKLGLQPAHVKAADSLADIFGMKVKQVRDVTKVFEGWSDDELDTYARTGELPARLAGSQGGSASVN